MVEIVVLDEGVDALDELLDGGEGAAANRLGDTTEAAFDLIERKGGSRREVQVVTWALGEPSPDLDCCGRRSVDDQVQLEWRRHVLVEVK